MTADAFFAAVNAQNESAPGSHVIYPGLQKDELSAWTEMHAGDQLPADFVSLLKIHNGFRLWDDDSTPSGGYLVLLPLHQIRHAPLFMYGGNLDMVEEFPESFVCISDEPDSDFFILLDLENGTYSQMNPMEGYEDGELLGSSVNELLDWVHEFLKCSPFDDE